jgi:hypothetical protein
MPPTVPLAVTALLLPFTVIDQPSDVPGDARAGVRAFLLRTRNLARDVLDLGAYKEVQDGPRQLHPKSAAWRSMVAQAKTLAVHERRDLELLVRLTDRWLSELDHADEAAVAVMSDAVRLLQAFAGSQSALLYRVLDPDLEDARQQRVREMNAVKRSRAKAKARRATIELAAREIRENDKDYNYKSLCADLASRFDLEVDTVRHLLPASEWGNGRPR